jgi:hypothetical protein
VIDSKAFIKVGMGCALYLMKPTHTHEDYTMNNEIKDTQRFNELLQEAGILAVKINLARFQETVPEDDHTIRLCTILDILLAMEGIDNDD